MLPDWHCIALVFFSAIFLPHRIGSHQSQEDARKAQVDAVVVRGAAGSLAGITACIILQPLETIKTHMQGLALSQKDARPGLVATSRSLVKAKGVSSLWRGMGASSLRVLMGSIFLCDE